MGKRTSWTVGGALAVLAGTMVAAQGFGSKTPTTLRAIPAETTAAKAKDPNWKAPKTAWGLNS